MNKQELPQKNGLYDYWYSAKQAEVLLSYAKSLPTVRGKPYTEMIEHNKKPSSNFDDYVLVETGKHYSFRIDVCSMEKEL